eukprot:CAMPEP_0185731106 /NCGR_PEP_ID=MMETSP1171-20130828/11897_1 /TAXON_ID=374046 /ORGANISM="Helicotheca tamensis, Strain CCMP826" /LENGTH=227 /DNA_ID=CAMNT_0028400295 /DNA_START=66 /DNA_END=749 /DNA_ORIENTATION=-
MNPNLSSVFIVLSLVLSHGQGAFTSASSWERPHVHKGRLNPFNPRDRLDTSLDNHALRTLETGKPYKTSHSMDSTRVLIVQDVNASPDTVFSRILDYSNYSKMAPQTLESEIYRRTSDADTETFFSRLRAGMRGFAMEFFVKATHYPEHNSVTWTLDYTKESDIDDACGHWYVEPHPTHPEEKSRVYYSVDMVMGPGIPKAVSSFINKKAATDATTWVKKFSEQRIV